jgi:hypothetical protein
MLPKEELSGAGIYLVTIHPSSLIATSQPELLN